MSNIKSKFLDSSMATDAELLQKVSELDQQVTADLADKVDKIAGKGLSEDDFTTLEKTKLLGVADGATANATDAQLRDRVTHTGTQFSTTISDFAATVLTTMLSGLSTATNTAISSTDNVLSALGKFQAQITNLYSVKYDASNPSSFETTTQLNTRDTDNRARANHTGNQLSSTISNFASTVLGTALTGILFTVGTAITATDSVLSALGKLQKQITDEISARTNADIVLQNNINTEASTRSTNDLTLQSNIDTEATSRTNADTNLQGQITSHHGVAGNTHPAVTQSVNGFMSSTDKTRFDNLLARVVSPMVAAASTTPSITFTAVTNQIKFPFVLSRDDVYKSGVIIFNITAGTGARGFQIRLVNTVNANVLGTSDVITVSGTYVLALSMPIADALLEIQIRQNVTGNNPPTINLCHISFDTIAA